MEGGGEEVCLHFLHFKASKETFKLICEQVFNIDICAAAGLVVCYVLNALSHPLWVVLGDVVLNLLLVSCFSLHDASLQVGSTSAG